MAVQIQESSLNPGTMVDHFRVMRRLGGGGMGEVFLARDTKLGRKVALKVINPAKIGTPKAVESFLDEARLTARFNHPNIVTIYAVGEHEGCPYLALEYLEGETLRQRMRDAPPGPKESQRVALAISDALLEAHGRKILHRDLKPENVLMPKDGRLRVLDFGIAKALHADAGDTGTMLEFPTSPPKQDKGLCGTPAYMAPELWREEEATEAVDIWALGVILHELLVGRHPFDSAQGGAFSASLLAAVLDPAPVLVDSASRSKDPELAEIVEQCLRKDPNDRPRASDLMERLNRQLSHVPHAVATKESPFRGLQPFSEQHAGYFFGREAETAEFLERMRADAVLPVLGPSGSGKSSFVQAGVIPRLREQGPWMVLQLRPGNRPFVTLASRILHRGEAPSKEGLDSVAATSATPPPVRGVRVEQAEVESLAKSLEEHPEVLGVKLHGLAEATGQRVLLLVDQLEELYTLVEDEAVRRQFMRAVCSAADDPEDPVRVVFTLRDDFLGRVAEGLEARNAFSRVTVVRSPGPDALREVLLRAAEAAGYRYDQPDLVARMVAEVQGEPACLALLQFAARMLWERRDEEHQLLLASAYEAIGGVAGALAEHADGVLEGLTAPQLRTARDLLLRLITSEGTRSVVARRTALEGLGPEAEEVLGRLVQARLVTVRRSLGVESSEAELELVHESLIHSWGRLGRWVEESHEDRAVLAEIGQAAELWEKRGRRLEEVWYGDALREAQRSVARVSTPVPERVLSFLQAGTRREGRRVRRRRVILFSTGALLAVIAVVSVVVAMVVTEKSREVRIQRDRAEAQRREVRRRWAEAQREGARAAAGRGDLLEAMAKLRGSLEAEDSPLGRALWWQLSQDPLRWQKRLGAVIYDVAFSHDGQTVAAACQDRTVYLFDAETTRVRVLRGHDDQVIAVACSPDGQKVASGTISGLVRLVDLTKGTTRHLTGARGVVRRLAFSPRGNLIAAAVWDNTVRVWATEGGAEPLVMKGHTAFVSGVAWTPDGARLVSGSLDRTVRLWDARSGAELRVLKGHEDGVYSVALGPDGKTIASGSGDKTVRLWTVDGGDAPPRVLKAHAAGVSALRFAEDGKRLISGGMDGSILVWDLTSTSGAMRILAHHPDGVNSLAVSPDGTRVASAGPDKSLRLWSLRATEAGEAPANLSAGVLGLAYSPDGKSIAAGSLDASIRLWDVESGTLTRLLTGHASRVFGVTYSPDGRLIASAGQDKSVRLWNVARPAEVQILEGHKDAVRSVAFSPDGKLLASASGDKTIRLWDVASGASRAVLSGHGSGVYSVAFSPDGKLLASASGDKTIKLWDPVSGKTRSTLTGHSEPVSGIAFSPDGTELASGSWDRSVRLWDLRTGQSRFVGQHQGRVYWLDFHSDGKRIGAPSSDGTAHLWNLQSGESVTLDGHQAEVNFLRFSPDGRTVATASDDGTVRLWDADTGRPVWRCPLVYPPTLELFTHRGTKRLAGARGDDRGTKWRAAVAERAVEASPSARGDLLCLRTHDARLEVWDIPRDRQLFAEPVAGLAGVQAHPDGCLSLAKGEVRIYSRSGSFRELISNATALAEDDGDILIAAGRQIVIFNGSGEVKARQIADVGVSALLRTEDYLIVGFKEGTVEIIPRRAPGERYSLALQEAPSSPVVTLRRGPMGTLVVGFAKGLVGIWDLKNGARLFSVPLHGPVVHSLLTNRRLYAASALGDLQILDLSAFLSPYCGLVRQVWSAVPVVWEEGLAVRRARPADHPCAP